jgi:hypothetical protein
MHRSSTMLPDLRTSTPNAFRRVALLLPVMLGTLAADTTTKYLARHWRSGARSRLLRLCLGSSVVLLALWVRAMTLVGIRILDLSGSGLVIGGGCGKLLDRMLHAGVVTDFIELRTGRCRRVRSTSRTSRSSVARA